MAINLGDRLRQVVSGTVPRVAPPARPRITRIDGPRVADILAGRWVESTDGAVVVVDRYYAGDRSHGRARIGTVVETLEAGGDALDVLYRAWPPRDDTGAGLSRAGPSAGLSGDGCSTGLSCPERLENQRSRRESRDRRLLAQATRLCFLDIETTGLAGGAGTQAFLVGCGILEDGGLSIRQFLLPGFEHERALLAQVAEWTASHGTLVTFNGRAFDVPLIETRYLLHRLSFPLAGMPHVDMLHPARRLWKQRPSIVGPPLDEESCTLAVLERHLAGYHRVGDVPGFEMPSRYFRFVRDCNAHPLEAVLEHNRIDLLSLALVTARALTLIQQGPAAASHPRESLGLGRLYERAGAPDNAEACFAHSASLAARIGREPDVHAEALRRLALRRRRGGRMAEAAEAWQALVAVPGSPSGLRREAREALAIHHEHRSRDLQSARALVLDVLAEAPETRWRAEAEYRLRRIDRKLSNRTNISLPL